MRSSSILTISVLVLCVLTTNLAQAGNTVPWLTGTFTGGGWTGGMYCVFTAQSAEPGRPAYGASGYVSLQNQSSLSLDATVDNYTTFYDHYQSGIDGIGIPWCIYTYTGTVDGTLSASVGSLSFSGTFLNGSSAGDSFDEYQGLSYHEYLDFTFQGTWDNGWYSTGHALFWKTTDGGYIAGFTSLEITTITPEPSTFALLGTGLFPVIGVLRRKLLRG